MQPQALSTSGALASSKVLGDLGVYGRFNRDTSAPLHLFGSSAGLGCLPATRSIFSLTGVGGRAALGVARAACAITRVSIWRGLICGAV